MAAAGPIITPFSADKKHTDIERWVCVYPAYLNAKKTIKEGRKIPKAKSVDNPTYLEIRDVLQAGHFKIVLENKLYSREKSKELLYRGRIRVQLKDDGGAPLNKDFPTRESILLHLGEMIPQLKARQSGAAAGASGGGGQSQGQAQTSSSHHKKGKGKRR